MIPETQCKGKFEDHMLPNHCVCFNVHTPDYRKS